MVSKATQIYLAWLNEYIFVIAQVNIFNIKLMLINYQKTLYEDMLQHIKRIRRVEIKLSKLQAIYISLLAETN